MERTGRATGIHMEILVEIPAMMRYGCEIKPEQQNVLGTTCSQFARERERVLQKNGQPLFSDGSYEIKSGRGLSPFHYKLFSIWCIDYWQL